MNLFDFLQDPLTPDINGEILISKISRKALMNT